MAGNYKRKDAFYQQAKVSGYRSRAAYKLKELDQKYHLLRPGMRVLDVGAWPGGWLQVAAEKVGHKGKVVGVDLTEIEPLPFDSVHLITSDAREDEFIRQARLLTDDQGYDLVLSDMSAKHTGIKDVDQAAASHCAELAFWVAEQLLRPGGNLVIKAFPGNDIESFVKSIRASFNKLNRLGLKSTRKSSKEFYLIGCGFLPSEK